jgi:hypothetical protein
VEQGRSLEVLGEGNLRACGACSGGPLIRRGADLGARIDEIVLEAEASKGGKGSGVAPLVEQGRVWRCLGKATSGHATPARVGLYLDSEKADSKLAGGPFWSTFVRFGV